jgi:glutamyl/glutaminyl-tRNA synthetase
MPTIRGLLNRGLQPEVLKKYIVDMGLNNKISLTTWTKLWGSNKKFIDRIIPRYSSVNVDGAIKLTIDGIDDELVEYDAPLHSTNKSLGTRIAYRSNKLILNRYDTDLMEVGDRVGLLRYMVVEVIKKNDDGLVCIVPEDQSFKNTKHKVNWLVDDSKTYKEVELVTYDDLITKPSMEKGDNIMDIFNIDSKKTERVYVEINMNVDVGKSLQLERRGYYICSVGGMTQIPDSRAKAMIN